MPLKITLKPKEKMILSGAVITNGDTTANFLIENNVTILREKDILTEAKADSPARKIYFVVQLMYIDQDNLIDYHRQYWDLVRDFLNAAPSALGYITEISEAILGEKYYGALKTVRKLIEYEQALLNMAGNRNE